MGGGNRWVGNKGNWKQGQKGFKVLDRNVDSTFWIGGLPQGIAYKDTGTNFAAAGTVKKVQVLNKGQAIAWFSSPQEAQAAISMFNGMEIDGSAIQVDAWNRKSNS